jgi:hypothetical protein
LVALAAAAQRSGNEEESSKREAGRVYAFFPDNGSLLAVERGDGLLGIRWPGEGGREFISSGGWYLRFETEGRRGRTMVQARDFTPLGPCREFHEGCSGGKRYPHRDRDDDGDGVADEDRIDGIDNDLDGLVDEDFAAVGNRMCITRAAEPASGLMLTQSSYRWGYGHVRDFIGFTTRLEYPPAGANELPAIRDLEAVLYIDFDAGDARAGSRGRDDSFTFLCIGEEAGEGPAAVAVSDEGEGGLKAAAVLLEARGVDGRYLEGKAMIVRSGVPEDFDWKPQATRLMTIPAGPCGIEAAAAGGPVDGPGDMREQRYEGNYAAAFRLDGIQELHAGDFVEIEWAIVFARSEEALIKQARRIVETCRGVVNGEGKRYRWVIPARKAVRIGVETRLTPVWVQGRRQAAVAIELPPEYDEEELEWLRVGGTRAESYEIAEGRIFAPLDERTARTGEPVDIEGQLVEGAVFSTRIEVDDLQAFYSESSLPPGSLPEGSVRLYPNPFLTDLHISIRVDRASLLTDGRASAGTSGVSSVRIYDVQGRLVRTILEEEILHPGDYSLGWDGRDEYGMQVAPGVYYCKLQIGSRSMTKRVILLR